MPKNESMYLCSKFLFQIQIRLPVGIHILLQGEERNALECFWKAMELEREGSTNSQPFRYLMETILTWYTGLSPLRNNKCTLLFVEHDNTSIETGFQMERWKGGKDQLMLLTVGYV